MGQEVSSPSQMREWSELGVRCPSAPGASPFLCATCSFYKESGLAPHCYQADTEKRSFSQRLRLTEQQTDRSEHSSWSLLSKFAGMMRYQGCALSTVEGLGGGTRKLPLMQGWSYGA